MAMTTAEFDDAHKPKATIWKILSSARLTSATTKRAVSAWENLKANDSDADDADDNNKHENKEDIAKYSNSETSSTMQPVRDRSVDDGRCRQMHPLFSRCAARAPSRPFKRRRRSSSIGGSSERTTTTAICHRQQTQSSADCASTSGIDAAQKTKGERNLSRDSNCTPPPKTFNRPDHARPKKTHQTYLDIGHRGFCHKTCGLCGMIYTPGEPSDEEMHKKYHDEVENGVRLSNVLITKHEVHHPHVCCEGDRVTWFKSIEPGGSLRSKRIENVLRIMDMDLGYVGSTLAAHSEVVYVYVRSGRAIGCVTAMQIDRGYKVVSEPPSTSGSRSVTPAHTLLASSADDTTRSASVLECDGAPDSGLDASIDSVDNGPQRHRGSSVPTDLVSPAPVQHTRRRESNVLWRSDVAEDASCGINRMWVHRKFRRSGIATVMLDTIRNTFFPDEYIPASMLAFSQPTPAGQRFAETYTARRDFLVFG